MNVSLPILWPICEPCILEEKKEMITYYQKNREKILDKYYEKKEQKITYYEKNKEKILKKYYEKREERLQYQLHYNQNHKEEQKNRNKQYYLERCVF